jgi:hypothetical protein
VKIARKCNRIRPSGTLIGYRKNSKTPVNEKKSMYEGAEMSINLKRPIGGVHQLVLEEKVGLP